MPKIENEYDSRCKHHEMQLVRLIKYLGLNEIMAESKSINTDENTPGVSAGVDKKGLWKKISQEPLKDVILAILRHPPKNDQDCKEQQASVRFALGSQSAKEITGKITRIFIVTAITAMIIAIAPTLPGIIGEITVLMIKYGLIAP